MNNALKGIFVYGSCVGRDSAEILVERNWSVTKYVARQSLISAGNSSKDLPLGIPEPSRNFSKRIIREDSSGKLYRDLRRYQDRSTVLLWDIIPERLGVYRLPNGSYITRSIDKIQVAGASWRPPGATLIDFGSDEHFELWRTALKQFASTVGKTQLAKTTYLICVPWAQDGSDGLPVDPPQHGPGPALGNILYTRYYAEVENYPQINIIYVPEDLIIADRNHKWGPAIFHYQRPVYEWIADAIESDYKKNGQ